MTTVVETVASKRDECFRCGYALVGIADDQPCPECGLLAARSRRATDELHLARPAWLRRLSIGTWLILAAITWPVVWTILWILIAGPLQQLPAVQKASFSRFGRLSGASTAPPAGARMFSSLGWADAVVFLERHPQAGWSLSAALFIAGAACFTRREGHE